MSPVWLIALIAGACILASTCVAQDGPARGALHALPASLAMWVAILTLLGSCTALACTPEHDTTEAQP